MSVFDGCVGLVKRAEQVQCDHPHKHEYSPNVYRLLYCRSCNKVLRFYVGEYWAEWVEAGWPSRLWHRFMARLGK